MATTPVRTTPRRFCKPWRPQPPHGAGGTEMRSPVNASVCGPRPAATATADRAMLPGGSRPAAPDR